MNKNTVIHAALSLGATQTAGVSFASSPEAVDPIMTEDAISSQQAALENIRRLQPDELVDLIDQIRSMDIDIPTSEIIDQIATDPAVSAPTFYTR